MLIEDQYDLNYISGQYQSARRDLFRFKHSRRRCHKYLLLVRYFGQGLAFSAGMRFFLTMGNRL